jgi:transcription antitermination factor NusG
MPILPAEPDVYPPDLWERKELAQDPEHRWWCLHAKPRQEKTVARHLWSQRLTYYLPQVVRESRTPGGRKLRSVIPLFAGYLFLHGSEYHRLEALRGDHLAGVLAVADQAQFETELRQIHQMLSSGLAVMPEPTYHVGTRVRILTGPLSGIEGTVVRRAKRDYFVAVVHFIHCGATVELQDWQVERVDS